MYKESSSLGLSCRNDDFNVLNKSMWFQGGNLQALDMRPEVCCRLCGETVTDVHTNIRCNTNHLALSQQHSETFDLLADEQHIESGAKGAQEPLIASIESRLCICLAVSSVSDRPQRETGSESNELHPIEIVIASPPINRRPMPAAKFEFEYTERLKSSIVNALVAVRSLTTQTFRRLLVKM